MHVDHRDRRPVLGGGDREPAARRGAEKFAGRITRSEPVEVGVDLARAARCGCRA